MALLFLLERLEIEITAGRVLGRQIEMGVAISTGEGE
jgi:hypothetical protein